MAELTEKKISVIGELIDRWTSSSPAIFKKITNISIIIGTIAMGILSINQVIDLVQIGVDPILFKICGYVLALCGGMGLTSKITKQ